MENCVTPDALTIGQLQAAYRQGTLTPEMMMVRLQERLQADVPSTVWISRFDAARLIAEARDQTDLLAADPEGALQRYPLLGVPFAVKDNIDVAGLPTTAACPEFSYLPERSATAVERLHAAGALLIGKTNLDQFATGLVGTRSPYGAVTNPFDPRYISGGSSSGSAAAVAHGLCAFSLGTDTAGSGRVPAGFCNLVGIKPTPGLASTRGVVPACRSLDCVSIFAHTVEDGWRVLSTIAGTDAEDCYSHPPQPLGPLMRKIRVAIPAHAEFHGDALAAAAFETAVKALADDPRVTITAIAMDDFLEVATLLYDGPWVAERRAALGDFLTSHGDAMDPVVRAVIARADGKTAVDAFTGAYRLEAGKRRAEQLFAELDLLFVPTAPCHYTLDEIAAAPIERNSHLGHYTNFVNLLGLCALALPGPFRSDGLPAGITLIGPHGADHRLAEFARSIEPRLHQRLATGTATPPRRQDPLPPLPTTDDTVDVVVVGAHLAGLPLNWQLLERGARLKVSTTTAPEYRFYALPGTVPPKPGLLRVAEGGGGGAIAVEVWSLPSRHFGSFVADIPAPLGIGTLRLADGSEAKGFLCEPIALEGAEDITHHAGWRAYLASRTST